MPASLELCGAPLKELKGYGTVWRIKNHLTTLSRQTLPAKAEWFRGSLSNDKIPHFLPKERGFSLKVRDKLPRHKRSARLMVWRGFRREDYMNEGRVYEQDGNFFYVNLLANLLIALPVTQLKIVNQMVECDIDLDFDLGECCQCKDCSIKQTIAIWMQDYFEAQMSNGLSLELGLYCRPTWRRRVDSGLGGLEIENDAGQGRVMREWDWQTGEEIHADDAHGVPSIVASVGTVVRTPRTLQPMRLPRSSFGTTTRGSFVQTP